MVGKTETPRPLAPRPVPWARLGLTALLGLVAGTMLCPSPARGRQDEGTAGPLP